MNITLFKREIKSNYKMIILFMAIMTMYCSMLIAMFDPKFAESIDLMAQSMPELFSAFGMSNSGSTLIEFIGNYLYGFILLVIPLIFIILLGNKLVAKYVDSGSMAYLLATPNKRKSIVVTQGIFMALSILCLVVYATILCIIVSQMIFLGELDIKRFLFLNVGLYGLLFFLGGLSFLSSCTFNETRYSVGVAGGVSVLFVLLQMLSQVGEKFEILKYGTPLTLFNVEKIISGDSSATIGIIALYLVGLSFYIIGIGVFSKKDLSL